jgi:hypothetical protein
MWIIAVFLLAWAVSATSIGSYYYMEYDKYQRISQDLKRKVKEVSTSVNVAIDYGNGSRAWFNETLVPIGATAYNATTKVAVVETHPQYGESFIVAINGVRQKEGESTYWFWWLWDTAQQKWVFGLTACNEYVLSDNQTVIWYLVNAPSWPPPSPP